MDKAKQHAWQNFFVRAAAGIFFLLLSSGALQAASAVNGATALLEFEKLPEGSVLTYGTKRVPLLAHPTDAAKQIALVPVGYRSEPGETLLKLRRGGSVEAIPLTVEKGTYASETLRVAPSKVKPDRSQAARAAREYREAMALYNTFTPKRYWRGPFVLPMHSRITSPFGTARLYNGTLKSFHSGTDFKAAPGTPVRAVNDGVVVIAKARYYAGGSVVVDHGEGLYSCYYHLSEIAVKKGERIAKESVVGLSGSSGRVTGPHLHFAVMLHGVQVDPLQLVTLLNTLFEKGE